MKCVTQLCILAFQNNLDGVVLRCTGPGQRHYKSIRNGSFFAKGRHSIRTQMKIMCMFAANATVQATAKALHIRRATISEYFDNLRGELIDNLHDEPIQFTDNGEYEADECQLKHVKMGRSRAHRSLWIGGILERATGKVLLYKLQNRSQESLIGPICENVPHGSWIYTDEWISYRALSGEGYVHFTVNHSRNEYSRRVSFAGVTVNVHINTMEGLNREIRQKFANKSNRNTERVDLILAEIMYRHSGHSLFWPFKI